MASTQEAVASKGTVVIAHSPEGLHAWQCVIGAAPQLIGSVLQARSVSCFTVLSTGRVAIGLDSGALQELTQGVDGTWTAGEAVLIGGVHPVKLLQAGRGILAVGDIKGNVRWVATTTTPWTLIYPAPGDPQPPPAHKAYVTAMVLLPDGRLVTGSAQRELVFWAAPGVEGARITLSSSPMKLRVLPPSTLLATHSGMRQPPSLITLPELAVTKAAGRIQACEGTTLVGGGDLVWSTRGRRIFRADPLGRDERPTVLQSSGPAATALLAIEGGSHMVTTAPGGAVAMWDLEKKVRLAGSTESNPVLAQSMAYALEVLSPFEFGPGLARAYALDKRFSLIGWRKRVRHLRRQGAGK